MQKHTLILLLIVAFIAGCAHTDEYYYASHGKAVKEYCPAGILQGKSYETSRPKDLIGAWDTYNFQVYESVKLLRNDLSACYEAVMKQEDKPGMFYTDLTISAAGAVTNVNLHKETVMHDLEALNIPGGLETCLATALTGRPLPVPPKANSVARVYFVAYQLPPVRINTENLDTKPTSRGYVMNTWSVSQLCSQYLPFDTSHMPSDNSHQPLGTYPQFTIDGYLNQKTLSAVYHRNFNQFNACIRQETHNNSAFKCPVVVNFTLKNNGTVSAAVPGSGLEENADIETCIAGKLKYIEFPPNAFIGSDDRDYTFDYCGVF